jgi:hypothetical protein
MMFFGDPLHQIQPKSCSRYSSRSSAGDPKEWLKNAALLGNWNALAFVPDA